MRPEDFGYSTEDVLKEFKAYRKDFHGQQDEWRKDAKECFDFESSRQWSQADESVLNEQGRIPVTFNRTQKILNAVCGMEIQNRQQVRYIPRTLGAVGFNEILTSAADWVRDNCSAEDEESESFRDMLICGMGWTCTRLCYDDDQEGKIIIERVDPLEMGWDSNAKKKNLSDARCVWRTVSYSKEEFEKEYPGYAGASDDEFSDINSEPHNADSSAAYRQGSDAEKKKNNVDVYQYQWYIKDFIFRVLNPGTGQIESLDHETFEALASKLGADNLRYVKVPQKKYYQAFITGEEVLEMMLAPCKTHFSFNAMTGLRDRNRNSWTAMGHIMRDPQRWANKWLSQMMHIMNSNAKGGLLAETGAFVDPKRAEEDWASSDSVIWMKDGGIGKIQERTMGQFPATVDRLLQSALDAINDVVGVSSEFMGLAGQAQAGYLEHMRKQSGVTLLAPYFDALRRYRKDQGRVLAYFIQNYISDGRLVRVVGEDGAQYLPLNREESAMDYDVIVDDAPTSPNMKERTFTIMMELLPMALQAGIPVPPEVIDYAPLPDTLVQKWKAMLKPQQPDPMAEQVKQLAIAKEVAQVEETQSKTALNYSKINDDAENTQIKRESETVKAYKVGIDAATPDRGML